VSGRRQGDQRSPTERTDLVSELGEEGGAVASRDTPF